MKTQLRDRLVVFRLSEDEYDTLTNVCERRGGRNLADFTRAEVLDYLQFGPQPSASPDSPQNRVTDLEREVADLRAAVAKLHHLVSIKWPASRGLGVGLVDEGAIPNMRDSFFREQNHRSE